MIGILQRLCDFTAYFAIFIGVCVCFSAFVLMEPRKYGLLWIAVGGFVLVGLRVFTLVNR